MIASLLAQVPTTVNDLVGAGDGLNTGGYAFNAQANEDRNIILVKAITSFREALFAATTNGTPMLWIGPTSAISIP